MASKVYKETMDVIPQAYKYYGFKLCNLTGVPIRNPLKVTKQIDQWTSKTYYYEEAFINAWIETQKRNNKTPLLSPSLIIVNLQDPNHKHLHDPNFKSDALLPNRLESSLKFDHELSDEIELRLLLLKAQEHKKAFPKKIIEYVSSWGT